MLSAGCIVYMKTLGWQRCFGRCAGADAGGLDSTRTASAGPKPARDETEAGMAGRQAAHRCQVGSGRLPASSHSSTHRESSFKAATTLKSSAKVLLPGAAHHVCDNLPPAGSHGNSEWRSSGPWPSMQLASAG